MSAVTAVTPADIQDAARRCAFQTGMDADDLLQEFHVLLIERREQFSRANRSYILKRFDWTAQHIASRERVRACLPLSLMDDEGECETDVVDDQALTPEQIVMERQAQAEAKHRLEAQFARLTGRQERIARELMAGYRKADIAGRLGLSRSMVSQEVGAIRAVFAGESLQLGLFWAEAR